MGCIFCDIVDGKVPCQKVYEDDSVLAFKDVEPCAPVHVLVIPKKHIKNVLDVKQDVDVIANIFSAIQDIASILELKNGFRVVNNCGEDGGQTVEHMHFHLLAKRKMQWPPG